MSPLFMFFSKNNHDLFKLRQTASNNRVFCRDKGTIFWARINNVFCDNLSWIKAGEGSLKERLNNKVRINLQPILTICHHDLLLTSTGLFGIFQIKTPLI